MATNDDLKDKVIEELRRYSLELEKTLKEKEIEISLLKEKLTQISLELEKLNKQETTQNKLREQNDNKKSKLFNWFKRKK